MNSEIRLRYLRRLETWPAAIRRYLYVVPGSPDLGCFGPGDHGHWSMQANNTAAAAFAVLATDPELDDKRAGMSRDEILAWALRLIRFSLYSHRAGGGATLDGDPWGHSWISALSLERMMHGVEALDAHLGDEDRERLERVLVSECNWLMDEYYRDASASPGEITAGLVEHNHPENNIWNGCILHRTVRLFPDVERHDEYLEKGTAFLLNGISVESDSESDKLVGDKPLSEWYVGANFFPSFALNHHRYLNVGYMAICLSNIAMLHFSCRANGWTPPEGLYHHARELWQLVKTCTFPDGRLWRIGGDTRVRYCYCQDYAVPTWLLARDRFKDEDAEKLETGWLSILDKEADANPDDAFLSERLAELEEISPLYYVRLEGDRAVSLSMGAYWRRSLFESQTEDELPSESPGGKIKILSEWSDEYHGSVMVRSSRRMASWTWRAAKPPQGQCLPTWASSMAEWEENLAGSVQGTGTVHEYRCEPVQCQSFDGGFVTCGRVTVHSSEQIAEGDTDRDIAFIDLASAALPDDRTLVILQRGRVGLRTWLRTVKGLYLRVPNDIFNGMRRCFQDTDGAFELKGGGTGSGNLRKVRGDWLNIDEALSVLRIYGPNLVIHRPAERQIAIKGKARKLKAEGHLYADEICCGFVDGTHAVDSGRTLFDLGAAILSGISASETREVFDDTLPCAVQSVSPDVRSIRLRGKDSCLYHVVANFGDEEAVEPIATSNGEWPEVIAGCTAERSEKGDVQAVIPPGHAGVMYIDY